MSRPDLPQLWGVLYADPNKNGERKSCGNCAFADSAVKKCSVVKPAISPDMVCGYHVEKGSKVPGDLAGLEAIPGGTSCNRCRYFEEPRATPLTALGPRKESSSGTCSAVEDGDEPAEVDGMGCCARWEDEL